MGVANVKEKNQIHGQWWKVRDFAPRAACAIIVSDHYLSMRQTRKVKLHSPG